MHSATITRRNPLVCLAAVGSLLVSAPAAQSADAPIRSETFTYKQVGDLKIQLDAHRTDDDVTRAVVVWIHGGALIMGNRVGINNRVKSMLLDSGYAVVSIDYRLAPETKLPAIIEDVEDAFVWLREQGPTLLKIDPDRMAVMGSSAGGYLTLITGHRVKPRPTALVAFWGYGDLIGDWYSKPSPHRRHQGIKMSKQEAYRQVSGPPIADSRQRKGNGGAFYQFCRQQGLWPKAVSGWDPHAEAKKFTPYMPAYNVTSQYPPTMLIHGTRDTDVPYEQSTMMAAALEMHGVDHKLVSVAGGEHGLARADKAAIDQAYASALQFVLQRVAP